MIKESAEGTHICRHRQGSVQEVAMDNREATRGCMSMRRTTECRPFEKMQAGRGWEGAQHRRMYER